jgi:predicted Ser/Thr protein kinase
MSREAGKRLLEESFTVDTEDRKEAERFFNRLTFDDTNPLLREPSYDERQELRAAGYNLQQKLTEGGAGIVYRAEQANPRRIVAIKFLKTSLGPDGLERLQREIELACKISHPDLVQIYEAGHTSRGRPYFVMEYVDGHNLVQYCQRLNLEQRLRLMVRVCDAVGTLHKHGVIHKDLKPGNILVNQQGHPKIIDFGIARSAYADWRDERIAAMLSAPPYSEDYAPPEQRDVRPVDTSADCFALGRILLELLANEKSSIFEPQPPSILARGADCRLLGFSSEKRMLKSYKGDLDAIVLKATDLRPGARYQFAADLAEDLSQWLVHKPVSAVPRTASYEAKLFMKRNPWWVALSATFVLGLVAATAYALDAKVKADRAREATELSLQREREAVREAAEQAKKVSSERKISDSAVRTTEELVKRMALQTSAHGAAYATALAQEWIGLWENSRNKQYADELILGFGERALEYLMICCRGQHPLRQELIASNKYLRAQKVQPRSTEGFDPRAWHLLLQLQAAIIEVSISGSVSAADSLRADFARYAQGPFQDQAAREAIATVVCGVRTEQRQLQKVLINVERLCK